MAGVEEAPAKVQEAHAKQEDIMIAHGHIDTGPPPAVRTVEDEQLDTQRSGAGFLSFMLFPLISIAAIAFAAYELVR